MGRDEGKGSRMRRSLVANDGSHLLHHDFRADCVRPEGGEGGHRDRFPSRKSGGGDVLT